MSDAINPDHYKQGSIECIEAMKIVLTPEEFRGYLKGNVFKYLWREKDKNGNEDLRKGKSYYDRLIELIDEIEQQKAADLQSLKDHPFGEPDQPAWTPQIGDWVRIKKPESWMYTAWMQDMDKYDGAVVLVAEIEGTAIIHDEWAFDFGWLEEAPEEQPVIKQSLTTEPSDGWRFLEVGEVIRKGDQGFEKGLFHAIEPMKIGVTLQAHWMPTIRRNRFEVGEKVVHVDDRHAIPYEIDEYIYSKDAYVVKYKDGHYMYHWSKLAPYIEDAGEVTVEVTGEVKNPLGCPDGWRFLEAGEVIRKGDVWLEDGQIHSLGLLMIGQTYQTHWMPTIRRNRFEVGEKVVRVSNGVVYKVVRILSMGYLLESEFCSEVILHGKDLAPCIEETK